MLRHARSMGDARAVEQGRLGKRLVTRYYLRGILRLLRQARVWWSDLYDGSAARGWRASPCLLFRVMPADDVPPQPDLPDAGVGFGGQVTIVIGTALWIQWASVAIEQEGIARDARNRTLGLHAAGRSYSEPFAT